MQRNTKIVVTVLLLHVAAIWALQSGLMRKVVDLIVPAEVIVEMASPEEAAREKAQPRIEQQATPTPQRTQVAQPVPQLLAVNQPNPVAAEQVYLPAPVTAPSTHANNTPAASPSPTVAAPSALVLPSTDADYLNNPKPPYPPLSKRLNEQGKVVVRTLIGVDGTAQQAEIKQSSGFDRLDEAARATALRWRYVPGKRAGVAEAMWFNVPFTFELTK
ncbi:MAG: energy transducer TonB [Rhodoferax sp.]|nr:energy transducer TonB [Rhodoferax sp.]